MSVQAKATLVLTAVNTLLLAAVIVIALMVHSSAARMEKETHTTLPAIKQVSTRALDVLENPLKMLLPSTPLAGHVAKLLVHNFGTTFSTARAATTAFNKAMTATSNQVGSPKLPNSIAQIDSILQKASSVTWGDGSSVSSIASSNAVNVPATSGDFFKPLTDFLDSTFDKASWALLGKTCLALADNVDAVDWKGTYTVFDTIISYNFTTGIITEDDWATRASSWDWNSNINDILVHVRRECTRVKDLDTL